MRSSAKKTAPAPPARFDIGEIATIENAADLASVADSADIFDQEGEAVATLPVPGYPGREFVPFGSDNLLPFHVMDTVGRDEILSQNLFFNILTAYGAGLRYADRATGEPSEIPEVERFALENSLGEFFLEQCTDMKYFFFAVAVVILNRAGTKIVRLRHKDACYCRFGKADSRGRVGHVYFANWRRGVTRRDQVEALTLLDEKNPLGHLEVLMGLAPGADGQRRPRTRERKFAVVARFPTPGQRYYPSPYYSALFRGDWFDLKKLIGKAKKAKIRNHASVRYQVEIHKDYWANIIAEEGIHDPAKARERINLEKRRIRDFVTGSRNSGKVWISGYYIDSYGKEQRMVRINTIDLSKEGGDWAEDIQEASNMLCYGTNIHPNLVGATPGKSQSNNSGSDKRELFTLKQSLETAFRDMLAKVHTLVIHFNGWQGAVRPAVPFVQLTTLDTHADARRVDPGAPGAVSEP